MPTPTTFRGSHRVTDRTVVTLKTELLKLGGGAHRMVYDLGDAVLKIAEPDVQAGNWPSPISACCRANRRERDRWEWMKGRSESRGFAAVLACAPDGSWLVQEKIASVLEEMNTSLDYNQIDQWYCETHEEVYRKVYRKFKLNDVHPSNIGLSVDGRIVVFDYAGYAN